MGRGHTDAPMGLPVSTWVPPNDPVPVTIFREDTEATAQQPIAEDEPVESLYTEDSSGEKRKRPNSTWEIGQKIQITPPDTHVEILEFIEEEDQDGQTMSIMQRKKMKANKWK